MTEENKIYESAFGCEPQFQKDLFEFCGSYIKTLKIEGKTVSMLFLLPCEIIKNGSRLSAFYIFAAATHPEKRQNGYMARLLNEVIKSGEILILRAASDDLAEYYKKFGFKKFSATDKENLDFLLKPIGGFKELTKKAEKTNEGALTLMNLNSPADLNGIYFPYTMP